MKNIKNIKNIIFDLGGVILNIDYYLTIEAFKKLGIDNFNELFSQANQNILFDDIDKGKMTSEQFRKELKNLLGKQIDDVEIDEAWNALLLDLPIKRLELLMTLKKTFRTFLLSNNNQIHLDEINKYLKRKFGITDLSGYFEKMYFSHIVGLRKPDEEFFNLVLRENNLNPEETLFIDDSVQHIEAAKKLGIKTHLIDGEKETILDYFLTELN
jgi:putative hydrolase of the HAD superfamily